MRAGGPAPTRLVYWLLLGGLSVGAALVASMRETGTPRAGALASLVPRAGVPRPARATFVRALPCLIALWALGGFTVVFAGAAVTHAGLHDVALVYAGVVAALAALGAATSVPRTKSASTTPRASHRPTSAGAGPKSAPWSCASVSWQSSPARS
jgi:hypothetical protein